MANPRKFFVPIDLTKNEVRNAVVQNLGSAPSAPVTGLIYFDTVLGKLRYYDGSAWVDAAGEVIDVAAADGTITVAGSAAHPTLKVAKALDHSYVTDFDTQVRTSRLDQMAAPTAPVAFGSQRGTGLADPTGAQDAATKAYVDGLVNGANWKAPVRAVATSNISLSGTQTIDGVAVIAGDRVLAAGQTTAANNGIYVVASGAWTRAVDADSAAEVLNAAVFISEGTSWADTAWVGTANAPITLGATALPFVQFTGLGEVTAGGGLTKTGNTLDVGAGTGISVAADSVAIDTSVVARYVKATITGDGAATAFTVTHNLNNAQPVVEVYEDSSGQQVMTDVTVTNANAVSIGFGTAPANGVAYRVTVVG